MKILLVEDDERIAESLAEGLINEKYTVEIAKDGQFALDLLAIFSYDLIILDWMLPKLDGITVCRKLRRNGSSIPILMLTAKDDNLAQVMGLDSGADDYIIKPFEFKLLLARIRALLRRGNTSLPPILTWEKLSLDPSKAEVKYNGHLLHLTPKEYALLELFLRSGDRVLNRSMILDHLWPYEDSPGEETVKVHLRSLRLKLKAVGAPSNLIETIYGIGYRLNPNI